MASYPATRSLQQASFLEKLPGTKAPLPVLMATLNPRGHRLSPPKDSRSPRSHFCTASTQLGARHCLLSCWASLPLGVILREASLCSAWRRACSHHDSAPPQAKLPALLYSSLRTGVRCGGGAGGRPAGSSWPSLLGMFLLLLLHHLCGPEQPAWDPWESRTQHPMVHPPIVLLS